MGIGVGGPAARYALIAALIVGGTYLFGMTADANSTFMLTWKGAGVWLLAVYAALCARDSDGYLLAAKILGVEPGACLAIEDTPTGIRAGKSAGMRVVGVCHTYPREKLHEADVVVERIGEIVLG